MIAPFLFPIVLDNTMREATDGKEKELGFKLDWRGSRRQHPTVFKDTDFADDFVKGHKPSSISSH